MEKMVTGMELVTGKDLAGRVAVGQPGPETPTLPSQRTPPGLAD